MARMNWDRARRQDRVRDHGSESVWRGLSKPGSQKRKVRSSSSTRRTWSNPRRTASKSCVDCGLNNARKGRERCRPCEGSRLQTQRSDSIQQHAPDAGIGAGEIVGAAEDATRSHEIDELLSEAANLAHEDLVQVLNIARRLARTNKQ